MVTSMSGKIEFCTSEPFCSGTHRRVEIAP